MLLRARWYIEIPDLGETLGVQQLFRDELWRNAEVLALEEMDGRGFERRFRRERSLSGRRRRQTRH